MLPIILGVSALVGWAIDIEFLKRGMASSVAMNPATAVCLILLAFETIRLNTKSERAVLYQAGQLAIAAVIVVSAMKLSDLVFGSSFAIDQQLFGAKLYAASDYANEMAPNTAVCFFVLGWSMQFMRGRSDSSVFKAQLLALVASLPALLALIGDIFGTRELSGIAQYIPMAVNTALALLLISISVLFTYPEKGFMQVFAGNDSPSLRSVTTVLLPASFLIPFVLGWLSHKGVSMGFYDLEVALSLAVIMNIVALLSLSYITARKLFLSDTERKLAFYDPLTQLPNRRMLKERLALAMAASKRSGQYGAVMFLDLDNFKPLNDLHGHEVGDLLLIEVANRLKRGMREIDTVARFGGDEFVMILGELGANKASARVQAGIVAEKIRVLLAEPYLLTVQEQGKAKTVIEHHCTSSIGVALFFNHEVSDIIKWADLAMYQAKEAGRNVVKFYDSKA